MRWRCDRSAALLICLAGSLASAQDDFIGTGPQVEIVFGEIIPAPGEAQTESGDEVRAVFNGAIVGSSPLGPDPSNYEIRISGDDPETLNVQEGPRIGDEVVFEFFDVSRNTVRTDVQPLNVSGETFRYTFEGSQPVIIPIIGLEQVPRRALNLAIGVGGGGGGGGGNGGGGSGGGGGGPIGGNPDVNRDGVVDAKDAALVMRVIVAGPRTLSFQQITSADVDANGVVNTADALAVLRGGSGPTSASSLSSVGAADDDS